MAVRTWPDLALPLIVGIVLLAGWVVLAVALEAAKLLMSRYEPSPAKTTTKNRAMTLDMIFLFGMDAYYSNYT